MHLLAKRSVGGGGGVWVALALLLSACAPADDTGSPSASSNSPRQSSTSTSTADSCAPSRLHLLQSGTLTIGTDSPAYPPWFQGNDPTNGKGYESAVAYAVAHQLGFANADVRWVSVPFNSSYAPGSKKFDFDINQISITPKRAQVVDFSDGYYQAAQALVALDKSKFASATSIADLKSAKLGAQVGTTSLTAATDVIAPTTPVAVYDDTNAAKQALLNGQIDAIVVDLPTAFYISAAEIPHSTIVGQFQPTTGQVEQFGMLFEKGNPLVQCVDEALASLKKSGRLQALEHRWLSSVVDVPELS
jgi:polar amino acid transport system substrate-binding protein